MARKHLKFNESSGTFVEVDKPSVERLPDEIRGLPSSFVTKDTSDPDKIHALDAPHTVETLVYEQQKKEQASNPQLPENILEKYDLFDGPFNQEHIDMIRFKAIRNLVRSSFLIMERGGDMLNLKKTRHLWFPKAKLDPRELRDGRPPLRHDLPAHLKDKELVVNVYNWPPRIIDMLRERNIDVPDVAALEAQMSASKSRLVH